MILIIIILLCSPLVTFGQSSLGDDLLNNRQALEQIKSEIESLKKDITKAEIKSSSTLDQIKIIDRE